MFAFPDVFHFFAHKLARLSGRRLAFALVFARAFNYFFFWHNKRITPLAARLDVINNDGNARVAIAEQLKGRLCQPHAIESLISENANALLPLFRLISDQAFRRGGSLAGRRLEFLAARIVVRNKEVFNFAY